MNLSDTHPSLAVSKALRANIEHRLAALEQEHDIKVLFAVESGSRAWGFWSPDSDYDVRFIYIHKLDWYLSIEPSRDVIDVPIYGDYDLHGWDIKKALKLLLNSNATLVEWIDSPILYRKDDKAFEQLKGFAQKVADPQRMIYHYRNIAQSNWDAMGDSETVKLKRYLYVLRPLLAARHLRDYGRIAPMQFVELLELAELDRVELDEVESLLKRKMKLPETGTGQRYAMLDRLIEREFDKPLPELKSVDIGGSALSQANALFISLVCSNTR